MKLTLQQREAHLWSAANILRGRPLDGEPTARELWENGQYVEPSALGVLFIITLFVLVLLAQWLGKKYGVRE